MLHLGFFDTSAWMCAESASILELLTSSHSEKYRWYTGANGGQFGLALRRRGYAGKIVSFEPVSSVFEELKHLAQRDGNWEVARYAVGSENGAAQINVSRNSQFSSIKPLAQRSSTTDPDSAFASSESVEVRPLDDLVRPMALISSRLTHRGSNEKCLLAAQRLSPAQRASFWNSR
jgi:FkbM family methyltransferase